MAKNIMNNRGGDAKNIMQPKYSNINGVLLSVGDDDILCERDNSKIRFTMSQKLIEEKGIRVIMDGIQKFLLFNTLASSKLNIVAQARDVDVSVKPIGIFMEGANHYTGGRYYIFHMAVLISNYMPVIFYTDREPIFYHDFDPMLKDNPNFKMIVDARMNFGGQKNFHTLHNVVIGAPRQGGYIAQAYKNASPHVRLISIIFETPNYVSAFRDGADGTEDYWSGYKTVMQESDAIIAISETTKRYAAEWIGQQHADKISVIYPNVNYCAADLVQRDIPAFSTSKNRKWNIAYVSRMVAFKDPLKVVRTMDPAKYAFHLIGKVPGRTLNAIKGLRQKGFEITVHESISDVDKFKVLSKCDALIHPSRFEGFGMSPMEAGLMGMPVFAYDIPVFQEVYGQNLMYMPINGEAKFIDTMIEKANIKAKAVGLKQRSMEINDRANTAAKFLNVIGWPKITTGTIVFNGLDYLPYMLRSIYHSVYQIIIVDGIVQGYDGQNNDGQSSDGTVKFVEDFIAKEDILKKIEFVKLPSGKLSWVDKMEMQNQIAKRVSGEFYIKMDSDEIWKPDTIRAAIGYMINNPDISILHMPFFHFWLSFKQVAVDKNGKWSSAHPRVWRWVKGFRHRKSFNYFEIENEQGKFEKVDLPKYKFAQFIGESIYHFGYVRKLNILQNKIKYYKSRGIEDPNQVSDTVTNWEQGKNTQPTQNKPSGVEKFAGVLPDVLLKHPYNKISDIRSVE